MRLGPWRVKHWAKLPAHHCRSLLPFSTSVCFSTATVVLSQPLWPAKPIARGHQTERVSSTGSSSSPRCIPTGNDPCQHHSYPWGKGKGTYLNNPLCQTCNFVLSLTCLDLPQQQCTQVCLIGSGHMVTHNHSITTGGCVSRGGEACKQGGRGGFNLGSPHSKAHPFS